MGQPMRPYRLHRNSVGQTEHHVADALARHRTFWRSDLDEQRPTPRRDSMPAITQIRDHGFSDIDGQRKTLVTVAFSSDGDLAAMPVDVVNTQPCHLVGAD